MEKAMQNYTIRQHTRQRGFSLLGMIAWGVILLIVVVIGSQSVPIVNEYIAVKRAAKRLAGNVTTPHEAQQGFISQMSLDSVYKFNVDTELIITPKANGNGVQIIYDYQREIPLWGPAYLTFKFYGQEG